MKQIVIYIFLAVVIFVITLVFTNKFMNDNAIQEADRVNELLVKNVSSNLDTKLLVWEKSSLGFLFGELNIMDYGKTRLTIRKKDIPFLQRTLYDDMRNFLNVNQQVYSISLLMEPGIFPVSSLRGDLPRKTIVTGGEVGWGPMVQRGDPKNYDITDIYDYLHSQSYTTVKRMSKVMWNRPSKKSSIHGKMMMCQIPIYLVDSTSSPAQSERILGRTKNIEKFAGIFEMNVDLKRLREFLINSLPYGTEKSATFVTDNDGNIIFSTHEFYEQYENINDLSYSVQHDYGSKILGSSLDWNGEEHVVWTDSAGSKYFVYQDSIIHALWQIITICSENEVYSRVNKTKTVVLFFSAIGMLLIFICIYLIFRQMRSDFRQKAAVEEELKMAAQVQMSMLKPSTFSSRHSSLCLNAFMQPAKTAGGDLYDYTEQNGKLIFCIGDVSGKGMPAALFMTQVVSLFRNAVRRTQEPAEIVTQINDVLAADNPKMTFCTFFVGVISDEKICLCNAGHNLPILITSDVSYLKINPNLALGLIEGYQYKQETIPFLSSSKFICYTDGVTEAMNKLRQQYGEERLLTVLSINLKDINSAIIDSVSRYVAGAEQSDDITIVTVESKNNCGPSRA